MIRLSRRQISQYMGVGLLAGLSVPSLLAKVSSPLASSEERLFGIAFSSWCFHMQLWRGELKATDLPGMASELGVDALEWTAKTFRDLKGGRELMFQAPKAAFFHDLRAAAGSAGVSNKVMNVGGPFFLASIDAAVQQKALDYILQYIEPAQILGCNILRSELYFDGERKPGWKDEARARALEGVQILLEKTAGSGLTINVENHHGISSRPEWLAGLVEAVDNPRFGLTVDTNNFRIDQDNPYDQDHTSLPQYVDRYEGLQTLLPMANWISAKCYAFDSTGYEISMNYPRIIEIILSGGYSGYVSVEYEGDGDPLVGVRQSVDMLRRLRAHFSE